MPFEVSVQSEAPLATEMPIVVDVARRRDFAGREAAMLVAYCPDGLIPPLTRHYVRSFAANGVDVVLCLAVADMNVVVDASAVGEATAIVRRQNGGFDFAAWAGTLHALPGLWNADRLYFANDSMIGPFDTFPATLARIRQSPAEFVGLTICHIDIPHVQSFFFVLSRQGLSRPEVRDFWRTVRSLPTKKEVIATYEQRQLELLTAFGLTSEVLYPVDEVVSSLPPEKRSTFNPTWGAWRELVAAGFPFVKAELLTRRVRKQPRENAGWRQVLQQAGMDLDLVVEQLRYNHRVRIEIKKAGVGYGRWKRLRRLIGDPRFMRIRAAVIDWRERRRPPAWEE